MYRFVSLSRSRSPFHALACVFLCLCVCVFCGVVMLFVDGSTVRGICEGIFEIEAFHRYFRNHPHHRLWFARQHKLYIDLCI